MAGMRFWAHGTIVRIGNTVINGVESITLPEMSRGEVQITDNASQGTHKYIPGMRESGTMQLNCRKIPGDPGQMACKANYEAAAQVDEFEIELPASATDDSDIYTITFDGFVTGLGGELPLVEDTAASMTISVKVDGAISEAAA